ncbi:hypothetical protein BH09PSE4_BH09PSE4_14030 [soil metagenome]
MKHALMLLVLGTVLCGVAAAYSVSGITRPEATPTR